MASTRSRLFELSALALLAAGSPALAESSAGDWRQSVFLYGMGATIDGDAQIGQLQVPVDVGMSDFFDSLKFGAMAAYEIRNDVWSFGGDTTYMNLGWSQRTQHGRASASLDVEQFTLMATVGRRVSPHLEALLSIAYFDVAADLRLRVLQQVVTASRDANWIDPLVGLRLELPMGESKWRFTLRGDIGGFGVGSDLTWQALTRLTRQNTDRFGWYVGYRALGYDYEEGKGRNYQHYDLRQYGPGAGIAISF